MVAALLVVGGGRMGTALLEGILAAGALAPEQVVVVEPDPERRAMLRLAHDTLVLVDTPELEHVGPETSALLAVKPEVAEAAARLVGALGVRRLLSVVAGISSARLEAALPAPIPVVRAMPNTPALVGAGVTVISGGSHVTKTDLDWAEELLRSVGTVLRLPERQLDAVTGVSGSGPAYIFLVAEALIEAGVTAGLPRDVARTLASETILGAGRLLVESGQSAEELRAQVTSPGGTTAAAVRALEARAVRSAFVEAVMAAVERSRSLGR
jgi:pyrroline-5-carboxylate reductase